MKNVISFDVGMKNLAYCLFQVDDNNTNDTNDTDNLKNYKILRWEVINLCTPITKKCTKGGLQPCSEVAKYCKKIKTSDAMAMSNSENETENENENENMIIDYYCTKHAKKCNLKIPPSELDIKKIRTKKLVEIQSIIHKYNISPIFDKSHESVTSHINKEAIDITLHPTVVPPKRQKTTKEQMIEAYQLMYANANSEKDLKKIGFVFNYVMGYDIKSRCRGCGNSEFIKFQHKLRNTFKLDI